METLNSFELMVAFTLTATDLAIIGAYVGENAHRIRHYGRTFWLHVWGGLSGVIFGALALLAFLVGLSTIGWLMAILQGISIVVLAGPFAFPLARYTAGLKGFNMVGYSG